MNTDLKMVDGPICKGPKMKLYRSLNIIITSILRFVHIITESGDSLDYLKLITSN